jgi:hypothetical protein
VKNTADVTGGKSIAVLLQSILGVSAINPLVAFSSIPGGKREVLFFYFVPDTTRDEKNSNILNPNDTTLFEGDRIGTPHTRLDGAKLRKLRNRDISDTRTRWYDRRRT